MTQYSLACEQCAATLKYQEDLFGKQVNCPRCQQAVTLPFPEVDAPEEAVLTADDVVDDEEPLLAEILPDGSPAPARKLKKKKKKKPAKKQGWEMPAIAMEPIVWQGLFGVLGIGLLIGLIWFLSKWPDAPLLEAGLWNSHEKPLYKVIMPGSTKTETQRQAGLTMHMLRSSPSKDATFGVATSEGSLPADRQNLSADILLNDACNGSAANLEAMGAVEVARKSITLQNFPGKQLTMKISQARGYMILRGYMVGSRLYMLVVGGKGLHEKHPDVVKFFESFQILEKPAEAAPPDKTASKEDATGH
jgi:hypothetical protein